MRLRAEIFHTPFTETQSTKSDLPPHDLFLVKTQDRNGKYNISPVIVDSSGALPFRSVSHFGKRSSGIAIVNPPREFIRSSLFKDESKRIGKITHRHGTVYDRIPFIKQIKHTSEVIFGGDKARTDIAIDIARRDISRGYIGKEELNQYLKELQSGDARWIVLDTTVAIPLEAIVLAMNSYLGIDAIIESENKLIGVVIGFSLGVVNQGITRNLYFIPRIAMEGRAYFNGKNRTLQEKERFKKVYGIIIASAFVPFFGLFSSSLLSYLRNETILKYNLEEYQDKAKKLANLPRKTIKKFSK